MEELEYRMRQLYDELIEYQSKKVAAAKNQEFEEAAALRDKEILTLYRIGDNHSIIE